MKTLYKKVVALIEEIEADSRFKQAPALVQVNAPLALVQTSLQGERSALLKVKDMIISDYELYPDHSPTPSGNSAEMGEIPTSYLWAEKLCIGRHYAKQDDALIPLNEGESYNCEIHGECKPVEVQVYLSQTFNPQHKFVTGKYYKAYRCDCCPLETDHFSIWVDSDCHTIPAVEGEE